MNIIEILKQSGLSAKASKVYLSSLELGPASISDIAKRADLKRPTLYLVIEELLNKKLIYKISKGRRTFYHAEHPEKIAQELKNKLTEIEKIIPELETIYKHPLPKPRIRFYEGKEGLKTVYQEIASSSANVFTCVSIEKFFQFFSEEEIVELFKLAQENETKFNDLLEQSEVAKKYVKAEYRKGLGPTKFLPPDFKLSTDILIYANKVAMISFDNLVAVVIENQAIAETQKRFLKFLWFHL